MSEGRGYATKGALWRALALELLRALTSIGTWLRALLGAAIILAIVASLTSDGVGQAIALPVFVLSLALVAFAKAAPRL